MTPIEIVRAWHRDVQEDSLSTSKKHLTDDLGLLLPDAPPIEGLQAVSAYLLNGIG